MFLHFSGLDDVFLDENVAQDHNDAGKAGENGEYTQHQQPDSHGVRMLGEGVGVFGATALFSTFTHFSQKYGIIFYNDAM